MRVQSGADLVVARSPNGDEAIQTLVPPFGIAPLRAAQTYPGAARYQDAMMKPNALGTVAIVVVLLAILAAAGWYAAGAWTSIEGPPMPTTGYVALALGVVFSLIVGCGLMALLFYSSRHGYDEPSRSENDHAGER
jgi:hypothetical protein